MAGYILTFIAGVVVGVGGLIFIAYRWQKRK